jgi:hypothetical protein
MRQIVVVGLAVSLTAGAAIGDTYRPFTDFRATDATGRYYLVLKKGDGAPEDPGRGTPVTFEFAKSRPGSPPLAEFSEQWLGGPQVGASSEVRVRQGDTVLGRGKLDRCPGQILISSTGLGFAGLDVRGYNYGDAESKDAVVIVGSDGTIRQRKSIGELFTSEERSRFVRTAGGAIWACGGWFDERRREIVVVSSASRNNNGSFPHLYRIIDLRTGAVRTGSTADILRAMADRNLGGLDLTLELAAELKLAEAHKDLVRHFDDVDLPVLMRLRAAVALATLGDRRGGDLMKTAALEKASANTRARYHAVKHLPLVLGDSAAPVLCDVVRRFEDDVRMPAWQAMHLVAADAAVPALIKLLDEKGSFARQAFAMECLGDKGPAAKAAVPSLIRVLRADDLPNPLISGHTYAALALGRIGPAAKDALPDLVRIAKVRSPSEWGRIEKHQPESRPDNFGGRKFSDDYFVDAICKIRQQ